MYRSIIRKTVVELWVHCGVILMLISLLGGSVWGGSCGERESPLMWHTVQYNVFHWEGGGGTVICTTKQCALARPYWRVCSSLKLASFRMQTKGFSSYWVMQPVGEPACSLFWFLQYVFEGILLILNFSIAWRFYQMQCILYCNCISQA